MSALCRTGREGGVAAGYFALMMRVDKWLWTARLFKTRALAADAVKGGRVHINGVAVKPSREVRVG
jgi:ribosome-associated heat shock protein Hsp15